MAIKIIKQPSKPEYRCNCVSLYRNTIRLRKRIFEVYQKENGFSEAETMAVLICMQAASSRADEAIARLAGLTGHNNGGSTLIAHLRQIEHEPERESDYNLWGVLKYLQFKGWRGRRWKGRTFVLLIDTILLFWYPHGYLHLLRDNLSLRLEECVRKEQVHRKSERWQFFWKAVKATEISSRRIWMVLHDRPPEHPPVDWWLKVARQKGFTAESSNQLTF